MELYKSIIAYDGTEFKGFQRQRQGVRTVQAVLEQALRGIGWSGKTLKASGRTDAGVHASGQVIAFRLEWNHATARLTSALNDRLPPDVAVRTTERAPEGFDPRFSARSRSYRYRLLFDRAPDPLRERFAWRIWPALDLELMQRGAELMRGKRDFGALGRAPIPGGHTIRNLMRVEWQSAPPELSLLLEADAFLHRMVRRIVALLLQVGRGRLELGRLESMLADPETPIGGKLAPPRGLLLEAVSYVDEGVRSEASAEELLSQSGRSEPGMVPGGRPGPDPGTIGHPYRPGTDRQEQTALHPGCGSG